MFLKAFTTESEFIGYDNLTCEAKIIALLKDGKVVSFGRNAYGNLGSLNNAKRSYAGYMDRVENIVDVQAFSTGSMVQKGDGTLWTTGYNYYGTLGTNNTNTGSSAAAQGRTHALEVINPTKNAEYALTINKYA